MGVNTFVRDNNNKFNRKTFGRRSRLFSDEMLAFKTEERKCYKCNMRGHLAHMCKKAKGIKKNNNIKCFNCHKIEHLAKDF